MSICYEVIGEESVDCIRDLVNDLMSFQISKSIVHTEYFDGMSFETRMLPSLASADENYIMIAKDGEEVVGYVYSCVSPKEAYSNDFATFFDLDSVEGPQVGCLSQFYIKAGYRNVGIGTVLFDESMKWLKSFKTVPDLFIYVSNGNTDALKFYTNKGFKVNHDILDGFITVLRNN